MTYRYNGQDVSSTHRQHDIQHRPGSAKEGTGAESDRARTSREQHDRGGDEGS